MAVVLLLAPVAASCTDRAPTPRMPVTPATSVPVKTMDRVKVGDNLVVTARVARILDRDAVVVKDVDLPAQGLLVLGEHAVPPHRSDLVTASGTIARFTYADYVARYAFSDPGPYAPYAGAKCLLADVIRSDA